MPNMSPKKNPMPSQDPHVRNKNYQEVATGYTVEMAQDEARHGGAFEGLLKRYFG